jgi:acyl-CoA synthetase (AMP-forming)/AMP-acid ligase II
MVDSDGLIYIVDRKKDVIVCGGENIYPADIEAALLNHPKVYDAALIGIPHERFGEIPLAVIQTRSGVIMSENEMMEFCNQTFPRYRRPRRIIFDSVPRNSTGKIDKPVLRKRFAAYGDFAEI